MTPWTVFNYKIKRYIMFIWRRLTSANVIFKSLFEKRNEVYVVYEVYVSSTLT